MANKDGVHVVDCSEAHAEDIKTAAELFKYHITLPIPTGDGEQTAMIAGNTREDLNKCIEEFICNYFDGDDITDALTFILKMVDDHWDEIVSRSRIVH